MHLSNSTFTHWVAVGIAGPVLTVVGLGLAGIAAYADSSNSHGGSANANANANANAESAAGNSAAAHANAPGQRKQEEAAVGAAAAVAPLAAPAAPADVGGGNPGGDTTSPQPLSNADQNSGGANGQCPAGAYCSTRDGSASENGNGDGQAVGKPCAGCVGKADNKNPPGQQPGGSDRNNGYECDGNKGLGKGNPAHTGCRTPTAPSSNPVTTPPTTTPATTPATTPVSTPATAPATVQATSATAIAAEVKGVKQGKAPGADVEAAGSLARTGANDLASLVMAGVLLMVLGLVLTVSARPEGDHNG